MEVSEFGRIGSRVRIGKQGIGFLIGFSLEGICRIDFWSLWVVMRMACNGESSEMGFHDFLPQFFHSVFRCKQSGIYRRWEPIEPQVNLVPTLAIIAIM
jgi:hypothetical protein